MDRVFRVRGVAPLLATILVAGVSAGSDESARYEADIAASHLTVDGTSTLHDWKVEGKHIGGSLTFQPKELASLWENTGASSQSLAPAVRVDIPVASLTSGKREMDEHMHEALKAKAHPVITYRLESATITRQQTPDQGDGSSGRLTIDSKGILAMAGVEQVVDIPMQVKRVAEDRLAISGETSLRMTDFGINPPTAMLGMLRTGDTVHVRWTWVLARDHSHNRDAQ